MSWNGTHVFVAGAVLTAAQMNTFVSENFDALIPSRLLITTTGTQTALAIPDSISNALIVANNASLLTIQGITAGFDGQLLSIRSKGAGRIAIVNQSSGATAANRIVSNVAGNRELYEGTGTITFRYDGGDARWVVIAHNQGGWITPTYAAGSYTGNGSMTWTVPSGNITTQAYWLCGNTLTVAWYIGNTTIAGTPNTALQIGNGAWGGHTAAKTKLMPTLHNDNGAGNEAGFAQITGGDTKIQLFRLNLNWTASIGTNVFGEFSFEV